jgi:hypothetical protein
MRPAERRRLASIVAMLALPCSAFADDRDDARRAYDLGTAAHKRGDYAEAAIQFARADELAPSSVALRAALDEAVRAHDCVLGAELLERSKRSPSEPSLARSLKAAEGSFRGCAGRIVLHCPEGRSCRGALDGRPLTPEKPVWSTIGSRSLTVEVEDHTLAPRTVEIKPDETLDVPLTAPATLAPPAPTQPPPSENAAAISSAPQVPTARTEPPAPARPRDAPAAETQTSAHGLSPAWFWVGLGSTLLLGGATAMSGFDTQSKHNEFVTDGCPQVASAPCGGLSSDGSSAQLRTNVLIASTAVVALVTVVVGVGFTRWSSPSTGGGQTAFGAGHGAAATFEFW